MFEGWNQDDIDEYLSNPRNKYKYYLSTLAKDPEWYNWSVTDRMKKQKAMNQLWENWDENHTYETFRAEFLTLMGL